MHNGKLSRVQLEEMLSDHGLLPEYVGSFVKLLCSFEIAVPLDANTLLIPSLIDEEADKRFHETIKYTFPRKDVEKHFSKTISVQDSTSAQILPLIAGKIHTSKQAILHFTGVCYRRIVLLHHIPIIFWPRLLARCLSSASFFYKIILGNCVQDMPFDRLANPGDVVIGHIPCQWFYWKTGIVLEFDNRTLLSVSNLVNPNVVDDHGNRQASSSTVEKIRKMGLCTTGKDWQQNFSAFNNGFEINVPDYILESHSTDPEGPKRVSSLMSTQIMSHILEIIDEVLREWFKGDSGLYSDDSEVIQQFVPCPFCFGDGKTPEEKQLKEENNFNIKVDRIPLPTTFRRRAVTVSGASPATGGKVQIGQEEETDLFKGIPKRRCSGSIIRIPWNLGTDASAGFTFKHCVRACNNSTIMCPFHDKLKLSDLIPDVVSCILCILLYRQLTHTFTYGCHLLYYLQIFRDMLHSTIDKSAFRGQHKLLGQGGFGTVYRIKLYKVYTNVELVLCYSFGCRRVFLRMWWSKFQTVRNTQLKTMKIFAWN